MQILVAGATGFVGHHLVPVLLDRGHEVRAMSRHPAERADRANEVFGDIADPASLGAALDGIDVAYYLVHTLDRPDFVERDRAGAEHFADAARTAGVGRVVYLGGLGGESDELSAHLRSRREVEHILSAQVPTVALRAGIIVGDGSISWEILCQLVERLPAMITPRWVQTRTQPIALDDVVAHLADALDVELERRSEHFEVGAPEAMTYKDMLQATAEHLGKPLPIVPVPLLTPALSSHWLRLVTDVDLQTARSLVDSMTNEVVVTDRRLEQLTGHRPMPFHEAMVRAMDQRHRRQEHEQAGGGSEHAPG